LLALLAAEGDTAAVVTTGVFSFISFIHHLSYWVQAARGRLPFPAHSGLLAQQRQYVLTRGVGLSQNRDTRLLQYLSTGQLGSFGREVGVLNTGVRRAQVLRSYFQVTYGRLHPVLDRTQVSTLAGYLSNGVVHCYQSRLRTFEGRDVDFSQSLTVFATTELTRHQTRISQAFCTTGTEAHLKGAGGRQSDSAVYGSCTS